MQIDDVLAYFDSWNRPLAERSEHVQSIQFDDLGAFGRYGGMHLYSVFQAVVSAATMQPVAHEALLRARDARDNLPLAPAEAFSRAVTPDESIYFDRLCRMVHSLNFFNQSTFAGGDLYLNVSGRHLLSLGGGHGQTFEALLRLCGLKPTQIVLEILESSVEDLHRLRDAVDSYRSRGFRVAIDDFGCQHSNFDRLWLLTPDIVKLDRSLIVQATENSRVRRVLPKIIGIIHDLEAQVVCEGIETPEQHAMALDAGSDLLQGYYYARPVADVRLKINPVLQVPDQVPVHEVMAA